MPSSASSPFSAKGSNHFLSASSKGTGFGGGEIAFLVLEDLDFEGLEVEGIGVCSEGVEGGEFALSFDLDLEVVFEAVTSLRRSKYSFEEERVGSSSKRAYFSSLCH